MALAGSKSSVHVNRMILTTRRYYFVFIVASIAGGIYYILFMPETKGLNLEEIAAVFGDVVFTEDTKDGIKTQQKMDLVHNEDAEKGQN